MKSNWANHLMLTQENVSHITVSSVRSDIALKAMKIDTIERNHPVVLTLGQTGATIPQIFLFILQNASRSDRNSPTLLGVSLCLTQLMLFLLSRSFRPAVARFFATGRNPNDSRREKWSGRNRN